MTTITTPTGINIETTTTVWVHPDGGITVKEADPAPSELERLLESEPVPDDYLDNEVPAGEVQDTDDLLTYEEAEDRVVDHMAEVALKGGCFERDLLEREGGIFVLRLRHNPDRLPCTRDTCPMQVDHRVSTTTAHMLMEAYGRNILFCPRDLHNGFFWIGHLWD
jgi:hypothetical protein